MSLEMRYGVMRNRIYEILQTRVQTFLVLTLLLVCTFSSCTRRIYVVKKAPPGIVYKKVPPGQAKKVTGSTSAKPYAPGQKKKS
jgi:hypothetical protein